jgi:ketosteroid isomerase-like protein
LHAVSRRTVLSNAELCQRALDCYREDRIDELLELLDPEIEWATTEDWVERDVWHGPDEVRAGLETFFAEWAEFSNEFEAFVDGGDRFAVVSRMRGRARRTGIVTEKRTAGVCEVREGRMIRIRGYSDPDAAIAAVRPASG